MNQNPNPIVSPENNLFLKQISTKTNNPNHVISFPAILIVGASGTGKSRSIKNLPPEKTAILNIENKPLTFPGADKFVELGSDIRFNTQPGQRPGTLVASIEATLRDLIKHPGLEYIIIDSFSKYLELLMDLAKSINKGYDIFNYYNEAIFNFLELIKNNQGKFIILTAIDELVGNIQPNGVIINSRRVWVEGKKWEGKIEKEFSLVCFLEIKQQPMGSQDRPTHHFVTFSDGTTSSKTPEGMFPTKLIDNDLKTLTDRCRTYFKLSS